MPSSVNSGLSRFSLVLRCSYLTRPAWCETHYEDCRVWRTTCGAQRAHVVRPTQQLQPCARVRALELRIGPVHDRALEQSTTPLASARNERDGDADYKVIVVATSSADYESAGADIVFGTTSSIWYQDLGATLHPHNPKNQAFMVTTTTTI